MKTLLEGLQPLEGALSPSVFLGALPGDALYLTKPDPESIANLRNMVLIGEPKGDARLTGSYLVGMLAWPICEVLNGLALQGAGLRASSEAFALKPRLASRSRKGKTVIRLAFDLYLDASLISVERDWDARHLAQTLEGTLSACVDQISAQTKLGRRALWRLVGDTLAHTCLAQGRNLGKEAEGMELAKQVLASKDAKLFSKQTRFDWISLPENPDLGDWLRVRGGCCRAYTVSDETPGYCTACVLRDDQSRRERHLPHVRELHTSSLGR